MKKPFKTGPIRKLKSGDLGGITSMHGKVYPQEFQFLDLFGEEVHHISISR